MIVLENKDSYIWDIDKKIIEIINTAISGDQKIEINLNNEGPCLRSCDFYNVLDNICATFNIDKHRFVIYTSNIEEFHDDYQIKITANNSWLTGIQKTTIATQKKNTNLHTIGCFVGRASWPRLSLLAWLDEYFYSQSLLTCHYYNNEPNANLGLELNECMINFPQEVQLVAKFLQTCPRQIKNSKYEKLPWGDRSLSFLERIAIPTELIEPYSDIFLELVCETYYSGLTFFPTEKTFRPIFQMTPFIVFGPQGFLSNLQRCGFKTFSKYWDESYDELNNVERIIAIRSILEKLFSLTYIELHEMYKDMQFILEHNKNRLMSITQQDFKLVGQK